MVGLRKRHSYQPLHMPLYFPTKKGRRINQISFHNSMIYNDESKVLRGTEKSTLRRVVSRRLMTAVLNRHGLAEKGGKGGQQPSVCSGTKHVRKIEQQRSSFFSTTIIASTQQFYFCYLGNTVMDLNSKVVIVLWST
jgi:hypothetical protein